MRQFMQTGRMLRMVVLICILGLAVATPAVTRTRDQIEKFRSYLENTKTSNAAQFMVRTQKNPKANPEENSGRFEGDIVLEDFMIEDMVNDYATGRNAVLRVNSKWPNDTVIYEFGEGEFNDAQKAAILAGIADIERHTCVKFRYREPQDAVYVKLTGEEDGCYAHVGYWRTLGAHTYNLRRGDLPGTNCFRHATIVHEWMHILGFQHMHATHDRDDYVRIVEENISPGSESAFERQTPAQVTNYDIEYDYVSCLHYSPFAFSANGQRTIIALREHEGVMGQRAYITDKDWLRINRHYNCPDAWH